jgi:hypothetical protein
VRKRNGLMHYMKKKIFKRVMVEHTGSAGGVKVLNKLVTELNNGGDTFAKKMDNATALLTEADTCWNAFVDDGRAVAYLGDKFGTQPEKAPESLVFFPYDFSKLTAEHIANLSKFYDGRAIDLTKLKPDEIVGLGPLIDAMKVLALGKTAVVDKDTDAEKFKDA